MFSLPERASQNPRRSGGGFPAPAPNAAEGEDGEPAVAEAAVAAELGAVPNVGAEGQADEGEIQQSSEWRQLQRLGDETEPIGPDKIDGRRAIARAMGTHDRLGNPLEVRVVPVGRE